MSLFYEAVVEGTEEIVVTVMGGMTRDFFIGAQQLQWGYRLYGTGYELITMTDTSCV